MNNIMVNVKNLRDMTGAGFLDCKKALEANDQSIEKSIVYLRKKGLAKANKKSSRQTNEGAIGLYSNEAKTVLIQINTETDFAAKDNNFIQFTDKISKLLLINNIETIKQLMNSAIEGFKNVEDYRTHVVAKLGENISIRRFKRIFLKGTLGTYIHGRKIAAIVDLDTNNNELAKDIAMHITASKPEYIDQGQIPKEIMEAWEKVIPHK